MDAYIAALKAASACRAPTPDPFHIGNVIDHRDAFRQKLFTIRARQQELADAVTHRLAPYMPEGTHFRGAVVLAVPYFSCGGFSSDTAFFVDVGCLDDNLDNDFTALTYLVAHETYHAVQARLFFQGIDDLSKVNSDEDGVEYLFGLLLTEGSATYVAPPGELPDTRGPLTRLDRQNAQANANRLSQDFLVTSMLIERTARSSAPAQAAQDGYKIGFSGDGFQEMSYFVGARMLGDIDSAWGRTALVCIMQLPPEQFVLAHNALAKADKHLYRLSDGAVGAARVLELHRRGRSFETCRNR